MQFRIRTLIAAGALVLAGCSTPPVNTGSVSPASSGPPSSAAAPAEAKKPPTWGERYTWPSGVAIEVGKPATCKPGEYAQPQGIERAVLVDVKIVNGSDKPVDATLLSVANATFAGAPAEAVFDSNGKCANTSMQVSTVMPGKTLALKMSFAVKKAPGELQIEFQGDLGGDKAVFVGQA